MLYEYCSKHDIPHKQIGKLIVATRSSEIPKLCDILNRGIQNGVDGLKMVDGVDAMKMEPELQCMKAILSPVTGIVDSHSLMLSLVVCISSFFYNQFYKFIVNLLFYNQFLTITHCLYFELERYIHRNMNPHARPGGS